MIPDWALGVAIIILAASLSKVLPSLLRARMGVSQPDATTTQLRESLDEVQRRVGELEERVDFAERLLAKQREAERLSKPS